MVEVQVGGMTCGHCERAVRAAIEAELPGAQVEVDRPAGRVRVSGQPDVERIRRAIREAGYEASGLG